MANVIESRTRVPPVRGLRRERLDTMLAEMSRRRLTVVVASAGSGKTTALAQFAHATSGRVAWYSADAFDGRTDACLDYLHLAIGRTVRLDSESWHDADDCIAAFERAGPESLTLVIDDFHALVSQPAEEVIHHIITHAPDHVSIAIGSRIPPSFDTSRWSIAGEAHEISADDLRFRTWEAEQLFDDTYGMLLRPDDIARLTRRVEGWAAGFQLFHLAVRDKPQTEQRRLIESASSRSTLARQYLTQNVLAALPDELREFLVHSSVLGTVTGPLADELLGRSGSDRDLSRLEELEMFVVPVDATTYRYHEVLRSHLEAELVHHLDADGLVERYSTAGELLEENGHAGEALRCYARASRWTDVSRLAGRVSDEPFTSSFEWLDVLGPSQVGSDPWVCLARARSEMAQGRFTSASEHYVDAEQRFGDGEQTTACRRERSSLESFLDPLARPPDGWLGDLHAGLRRDALGAARRLDERHTPESSVAGGVLHLAAGNLNAAAASFDAALLHEAVPDWATQAGRLGRQLVRLMDGSADRTTTLAQLERLIGNLESAWLGRFARAVVALGQRPDRVSDAERVAARCALDGDPWGAAFAHLCAGVVLLDGEPTSAEHFAAALAIADRHGSALLQAAAHTGLSLTAAPDASEHGSRADRLSRQLGLGSSLTARLIDLRRGDHTDRPPAGRQAATGPAPRSTDSAGSMVSAEPASEAGSLEPRSPHVEIVVRCLGPFSIGSDSNVADLRRLRPRARSVVHRLALDFGRPVHRDILVTDLWGDADDASAVRNLQVAISSVRRALEAADSSVTIERADGGYLLTCGHGATSDLSEFSRLRRQIDDVRCTDATALATDALGLYRGELLEAEGLTEWVVAPREQIRLAAAHMARIAADRALAADDLPVAVAMTQRGLEIDRFDDDLWRLAIQAHERRGDDATAILLRRRYDAVLDELGVPS